MAWESSVSSYVPEFRANLFLGNFDWLKNYFKNINNFFIDDITVKVTGLNLTSTRSGTGSDPENVARKKFAKKKVARNNFFLCEKFFARHFGEN
jgi:hypothetical protein